MDETEYFVYTVKDMSAPSPTKNLLKKIILWSVIIGGILALFVPMFVKSDIGGIFPSAEISAFASESESPCELFGGERCIGGENVGENLADENADSSEEVVKIIFSLINFFIFIAAAIAVGFFVFGGYIVLTSSGDQGRQKNGRDTIRNALIGLVIILFASRIVQLVAQVLFGLTI